MPQRIRTLPGLICVQEGILLGGGRKKFALKIKIFPKNKQFVLKLTFFSLIRMGSETFCKSVLCN